MSFQDPLADWVKGYPKLAAQMELRPETAIFRRFSALNNENLLYYQAELISLEEELRRQQKDDSFSGHDRKSKYALNWYQLNASQHYGDARQLSLVLKIREILRLYNEALIQQYQIQAYPEPDRCDLTFVQRFLHNKEMMGLPFLGPDATVWGSVSGREKPSSDLITLYPRQKEDLFSAWIVKNTITNLSRRGCAQFMKPSSKHGVVGYEDTMVLKVTYWITSILASLIPITSIIILYSVHSMSARLSIIAVFNVLISVCLGGLTNAKRSEIFAVTAAFAAVQVVFVSADNKS